MIKAMIKQGYGRKRVITKSMVTLAFIILKVLLWNKIIRGCTTLQEELKKTF